MVKWLQHRNLIQVMTWVLLTTLIVGCGDESSKKSIHTINYSKDYPANSGGTLIDAMTGEPSGLIAMIAGEASGDMLASSLISAIKKQHSGEVEFVGIGGKMMQEAGFSSWHNMETLSVMGYIEVIQSLPSILKLRKTILKELLTYQPDVFIGVDAPDFNFYIEHKYLKQMLNIL